MDFIKPSFISKVAIKLLTQLETFKHTHDGLIILLNTLSETLPQVGNFGLMIDPNAELKKLCINKFSTFSNLVSKRIIVQRALHCCKDDLTPHNADQIFLQQLSKSMDYEIQENLALAKLNA